MRQRDAAYVLIDGANLSAARVLIDGAKLAYCGKNKSGRPTATSNKRLTNRYIDTQKPVDQPLNDIIDTQKRSTNR